MEKRTRLVLLALLLAGVICSHLYAASAEDDPPNAVVRIRSLFPADVESVETLGKERVGNGVVIDADGTILTLSFLTRDAEKIEVTAHGGKTVAAALIGYDANTGLSLLRPREPLGITPMKLGRSSSLEVGERAMIAGAGGESELLLTQVISRREFAGSWEYLLEDAIFVAPAFEDFSGAALMNGKGQLVGLGYLLMPIVVPGYGVASSNLFIPIDVLPPILADLKAFGRSQKPKRPWLGVNVEESHGRIFVTRVTKGGPAEKAGLKAEDMIVSVAGQQVKGLADFYRRIWAVGEAGVQIPLSVLTGDQIKAVKVTSADRHTFRRAVQKKEI